MFVTKKRQDRLQARQGTTTSNLVAGCLCENSNNLKMSICMHKHEGRCHRGQRYGDLLELEPEAVVGHHNIRNCLLHA